MLTAKTKSTFSDTHNGKNTQSTPRISKLVRGRSTKSTSSSPLSLRSSTSSVDPFPKSIDFRPTTGHRPSKIISSADKLPLSTKTTALQPKLAFLQEEIRRTREHVAFVAQEKVKAIEDLNDAKRIACENYNKLNEALVAQSMAEESSKIERLRADMIEKDDIEAMWKNEEEFQKKIHLVRNQHNLDVLALLSASKELQIVRQEVLLASDSRDRAINHSNDVMKIVEINAEKVDILSSEINQLNVLLDSGVDSLSDENQEIVNRLNLDIDCLKSKLEKTKLIDVKLVELELLFEVLKTEVNVAKKSELDASKLVDELKKKVELLSVQLREAKLSQKSSTDSLDLVSKQFEDCKAALLDSDSKLSMLREKVISLNFEVVQCREDLKNSEKQLREAQKEALEMANTTVVIKSELQNLVQEKLDAMENEKTMASEIESLSEEKKRLMKELEIARFESENSKKAIEELSSALQKPSLEAREIRELLLEKHIEIENVYAQAEHLRSSIKNTEESYQVLLDEARYEIICLKKSIERNKAEANSNLKEFNISNIKSTEEEYESESLKGAYCQVNVIKHNKYHMLNMVCESESTASANGLAEDAKADPLRFKGKSFFLDNEQQNISSDISSISALEAPAIDKMKEKKSNSDNEYEFLDTNEISCEEKRANSGIQACIGQAKNKDANGIQNGKDETLKMEPKLDFSLFDCDVKSTDNELDSKMASRSFRKVNVMSSENFNGDSLKLISFQEVKVKKALLNRLANLLKRRSNYK